MFLRKKYLWLLGCLPIFFLLALAPSDIFSSKTNPLNIPLYLAGNFGEPRTNHFHTGIDIRTNQKEGFPVFAVADGWVSRVKISPFGYGNAVYITHPNGYTTVYGHLSKLIGDYADEVKRQQYAQKSFEVDLYFDKNRFPLSMGQQFALSGNSGGSGGPHLHFEIRDAAERALNPQMYGFLLPDPTKPSISGLRAYRWDAERFNAGSVNIPITGLDGLYQTKSDIIRSNVRKLAFSLNISDIMDANSARVGIYDLKMNVDGQTAYEFRMDKIAFDQGRYWGAHIDYALKQSSGSNYHRLHVLPGENLLANVQDIRKGIINLSDDAVHTVEIVGSDLAGNQAQLRFQLQFDASATLFPDFVTSYSQELYPLQDNDFNAKGIRLHFPKGVLFDTLLFAYSSDSSKVTSVYSQIHHLHKDDVYCFGYYDVSIQAVGLPADLQSKAVLVYKDYDGTVSCLGGSYSNGFVSAKARSFGDFYIRIDNKAPVITPLNISAGKNMSALKSIRIKIEDDFSGIDSYNGSIDGKWRLMAYDAKNDLLEGDISDLTAGSHSFKITVTDKKGNSSSYSAGFSM